ncbi:MAG: RNA polymerase sigma factor [Proteobacteria bacterium]|nr:RNA polymerase sigma factor [Pseudomonadota bacterium]
MTKLLLALVMMLGIRRRLQLTAAAPAAGEPTDEQLFAAYRGGDTKAFDEIFRRYGPPITQLMRRQIRSNEDASDLVQQTFLQLHRARNDFREGCELRPWLYTIAMNLRREYFRKKGRRKESVMDLDAKASTQPRVDPVDVGALETQDQVRQALARLPESQRAVIQLHWFDGLSMSEVADVVGASVSAVKVRAHRGYKVLRAALEATDATETIGR